jgi:hypothetical protein
MGLLTAAFDDISLCHDGDAWRALHDGAPAGQPRHANPLDQSHDRAPAGHYRVVALRVRELVAVADVNQPSSELKIGSEIDIEHFESNEPSCPIGEYATTHPFSLLGR